MLHRRVLYSSFSCGSRFKRCIVAGFASKARMLWVPSGAATKTCNYTTLRATNCVLGSCSCRRTACSISMHIEPQGLYNVMDALRYLDMDSSTVRCVAIRHRFVTRLIKSIFLMFAFQILRAGYPGSNSSRTASVTVRLQDQPTVFRDCVPEELRHRRWVSHCRASPLF